MSTKPDTTSSANASISLWQRVLGIIGMLVSLPLVILFLFIMGVGEALLSPFYPNRGPYSGPPAIFRALVGMAVFTLLMFLFVFLRHHHYA